jgi:hypothetical protein
MVRAHESLSIIIPGLFAAITAALGDGGRPGKSPAK